MISYNTHTLSNGLRIMHIPISSPVMYCGFRINAGTRHEQAGEEGLAHFCEHMSFKGTTRRKAYHIIQKLECVGGDLNAFTNKENTVYHTAVLKEHTSRAIELLCDIVFNSTYPQKEIDKEVEVICDEIESYNDSPAELIYDNFEGLLFQNHSLGHNILGTSQNVRSFTTESAKRFTSRLYTPQNMVFYCYGDVRFEQVVRWLEKHTQHLPMAAPLIFSTSCKASTEHLTPYVPQYFSLKKQTHQTHVMLGNRTFDMFDERRMALFLLNNLLGGPGMSARLNMSLREKRGLVYTVESSTVSYTDTGVWSLYFGCDAHDVQKCLKLVKTELYKLAEKPLSPTLLQVAKKQLKGQLGIASDNREGFALDNSKMFLHFNEVQTLETVFQKIDNVTAKQMQEIAQTLLLPDVLSTYIIE